jgi:hypothetical protein
MYNAYAYVPPPSLPAYSTPQGYVRYVGPPVYGGAYVAPRYVGAPQPYYVPQRYYSPPQYYAAQQPPVPQGSFGEELVKTTVATAVVETGKATFTESSESKMEAAAGTAAAEEEAATAASERAAVSAAEATAAETAAPAAESVIARGAVAGAADEEGVSLLGWAFRLLLLAE